jgi:hypothetical protein
MAIGRAFDEMQLSMTSADSDTVTVTCRSVTEHEARLMVWLAEIDARPVAEISGKLTGPHSAYARTLTTDFLLESFAPTKNMAACGEFVVVDPCYWTPSLPFLYELTVDVHFASGETITLRRDVGLRRWQASGPNFRLERVRTVLRGATASAHDPAILEVARDHEAAILVTTPGDEFCRAASRMGVGLVADVRRTDATRELHRLSQHVCVLVALCDGAPEAPGGSSLSRPLLAVAISASSKEGGADAAAWADMVAVELSPGERPPVWLATYNQPVVAIRHGETSADLRRARTACDRLQAELAPEFNLAGYFVGQ